MIKNKVYLGDCLEVMKDIPDKSVDLIFTDLPYGTTKAKWDVPIFLNDTIQIFGKILNKEQYFLWAFKIGIGYNEATSIWASCCKPGLWQHYKRVIKDNGAILLFAQTPSIKYLEILIWKCSDMK